MFVSFSVAIHMLYFPENCVSVVKSLRGSVTPEILVGTQKTHTFQTDISDIYCCAVVEKKNRQPSQICRIHTHLTALAQLFFFLFRSSFKQCVVTVGSSGVDREGGWEKLEALCFV